MEQTGSNKDNKNMDKPDSGILNSDWLTYAMLAVTTVWGGLVSYFNKVKKHSWRRLFTHLSSSAFAGMLMSLLCQTAGFPVALTGALSGIAAYMGTPALVEFLMRSKYVKKFLGEEAIKE